VYTYSIAARYMFKRRSTKFAIILVAIIVLLYLMVISVLEGFKNHYMDKIQSIMAHVTVDVGNYAGGIEYPKEWAKELSTFDPGIKGVTAGIESPAMAIFKSTRTMGTLRGIDLKDELTTGRIKDILQPNTLTEFGTQKFGGKKYDGCIVGGAWRKAYNLKINQRISFVIIDESNDPKPKDFNIIGFYEGKNPYLEGGAYIDRKVLAEQLQVDGHAKTLYFWLTNPNRPDLKDFKRKLGDRMREILEREDKKLADEILVALKPEDKKMYDAARAILQRTDPALKENAIAAMTSTSQANREFKLLADSMIEVLKKKDERLANRIIEILNREERTEKVNVETWQEKDNNFYEAVTQENLMMRGIMGVFLMLTNVMLFLIFDAMVSEKIRDIGALRALGASPGGIRKCFLMQAFFIGAMGVVIGMVSAEVLLHYMNAIPFIRNNIYPSSAFAVTEIPYVTLNYDRIVIAVSSISFALAGAAYPAVRASRMNPVECLRHE
jgi:ABC-type lipoprotein release transport system permease subunit